MRTMKGGKEGMKRGREEKGREGGREGTYIDVTKPAGLAFLRVVQPTGPIHRDICYFMVQLLGPINGTPGIDLTELHHPIEDRAIRTLPHVELMQILVQRPSHNRINT